MHQILPQTRTTLNITDNTNSAYDGTQRGEHPLTVPIVTLVTTGQLAAELGVSRSAVLKWHRAGLITPELITPGNHLRWDAQRVREQLRARRQRDQ
jgi:hypothetical protein